MDNAGVLYEIMMAYKPEFFKEYFENVSRCNEISPEDQTTAKQYFVERVGDQNFEEFITQWKDSTTQCIEPDVPTMSASGSNICRELNVFDPLKRRYLSPLVLPPSKRRRREEFDAFKFLTQKRDNGEGCRLRIRLDVGYIAEDYYSQQKDKPRADQSVRKIAQMAAHLNQTCSYKILETHMNNYPTTSTERHIYNQRPRPMEDTYI